MSSTADSVRVSAGAQSSSTAVDPGFRRLLIITTAWIWLLILVGGIVRVTGSGLGCPDWPLCYGQVLPPGDITAMIEFSHRFVAGIGGLLILASVIQAWRLYRDRRWIVWPLTAMIIVLPAQILLGAVVVLTELEPLSVAIHLGTALIIFGAALLATLVANRPAGLDAEKLPAGYLNLMRVAVAALFVLVTTGAIVVGEGASFACPDWPLCQGMLLPLDLGQPVLLHFIHRASAIIVGLVALWVMIAPLRDRASRPILARWAIITGVMFAAQIIVGAIKIWTHEATIWRIAHLGVAALVWGALVILASLAYMRARPDIA